MSTISFPTSDRVEIPAHLRLTNGGRLESRAPVIFDHFAYGSGAFNSHVPQNWVTTETGAATPFAPSASIVGTYATAVTGATTANAEEIGGKGVIWKPSTMSVNQRMVMEVRAKFVGATTATDGDFCIGLADANTYSSGLAYVVSAASALTTTAPNDFAGFFYSSLPTSGALFGASGNFVGYITSKAGVDTGPTATTLVKDSNFHIYRIELDSSGNVVLFIDDVFVGSAAAGITASVALTPYVAAVARNSHAVTATLDWIMIGSDYV